MANLFTDKGFLLRWLCRNVGRTHPPQTLGNGDWDEAATWNRVHTSNLFHSVHQTRSKLPELVLAKFRGNVTEHRSYWDSFQSAVNTNPGLSKIGKFNYFNSLLEGIALHAVQGLTVTDANYDAAVEILYINALVSHNK